MIAPGGAWLNARGEIDPDRLEQLINECVNQSLELNAGCEENMGRLHAAAQADPRAAAAVSIFRRRLAICKDRALAGGDCERILRGDAPIGDLYAGPKCPEEGNRSVCLPRDEEAALVVLVRLPPEPADRNAADPSGPDVVMTGEGAFLRSAGIAYSGNMRFELSTDTPGAVEIFEPVKPLVARDKANPTEPFHVIWKVRAKADRFRLYVKASQLDAHGRPLAGASPRLIPVEVRAQSWTERFQGWTLTLAALGLLIGAAVAIAVNLDRLIRAVRNIGNALRGKPSEPLPDVPKPKE